ncbi:hypothetical protein SBV1_3510004 [Verrucomicrobia bacterium]|nr:hypothetical protein SBV1_3510004 [Verrucomicrobiota bacterium]
MALTHVPPHWVPDSLTHYCLQAQRPASYQPREESAKPWEPSPKKPSPSAESAPHQKPPIHPMRLSIQVSVLTIYTSSSALARFHAFFPPQQVGDSLSAPFFSVW